MNETVEYYNSHANDYFDKTSRIELNELYETFLSFIPVGGRIVDLGCGSGRDVKWFGEHGYQAFGIDASEELIRISKDAWDIPVEVGLIENWKAEEPFDGIWCCASLMHLDEQKVTKFFSNLKYNLKKSGVLFISVKSGIKTGFDEDGRFLANYSEEEIRSLVDASEGLRIVRLWYTADELSRNDFRWLNAIIQMC